MPGASATQRMTLKWSLAPEAGISTLEKEKKMMSNESSSYCTLEVLSSKWESYFIHSFVVVATMGQKLFQG